MAAPGKNKLENSHEIDNNSFPDEEDELLLVASKEYEEGEREKCIDGSPNERQADQSIINDKSVISENKNDEQIDIAATPLQRFRRNCLSVTELTQQNWCEQQLLYKYTMPTIGEENPVMVKGSDIHFARELEVHDVVQVKTTSREDSWGIKILNMLSAVLGFLGDIHIAREVPIFGMPFGEGVFVTGIIDELRFEPDTFTIDLRELKTKYSHSNPPKSQQKQHSLQVMIYKKLFDDLVKGKLSKEIIQEHFNLDLNKEFGDDIKTHADQKFLACKNLNELLDILFQRLHCLTCINQVHIEYIHQESRETICVQEVKYDENELHNLYVHYLKFWKGQRPVEGVDIEEAWKCQKCDFEAICEWRKTKAEEYAQKNIVKNKLI